MRQRTQKDVVFQGYEREPWLVSQRLERRMWHGDPGHAVASDDKKIGFNTMSRRAIFAGLRRWWPELIPAVRLWYARRGRLFTFGKPATGPDGEAYYSEEGCARR